MRREQSATNAGMGLGDNSRPRANRRREPWTVSRQAHGVGWRMPEPSKALRPVSKLPGGYLQKIEGPTGRGARCNRGRPEQ